MKRIVFYDDATLAPYSQSSLDGVAKGLGGAEVSAARVALKLSESHHVTVAQRGRTVTEGSARLQWVPLAESREALSMADAIVILRRPGHMVTIRRFNRDARAFIWYHDWNYPVHSVKPLMRKLQSGLRAEAHPGLHHLTRVSAVGVSQTHAQNIREHLGEAHALRRLAPKVRVDYVYNPIPDELGRSDVAFDPNKLVFLSAAWKGLDMVLDAFQVLRRSLPEMRLHVASPGYADTGNGPNGHASENVVHLGSLSHAEVMDEVRTSLCVFYPADRVPETFGCVFAESHAVGTPVLAHPFGAACELLDGDELVDARDLPRIVDRVRAWREGGRPHVSCNDEMRLSSVAESWERLLFGAPSSNGG
jgi:glycosyltransferase involved in cell wall biosynthesis